ncbi:hypothetical protein [Pseudoxanthomonas sacheonensis]|uniref:Uncharacterized protein n=1 Tax=Pseudoxanthomonas sacheonensis TaxID=443615 RepID=A0ABU1RUF3_9GAMM|nr:hypothetical protein [Pseudoxanthomonas sacheonensis]MDR6842403.1 hypothetical protein [Pseudoxanthomonas sacheonensis]
MSDGDIDYSKFTLLELEEALAGINRQQYPKNYESLRSTYEQRTALIAVPPPSAIAAPVDHSAHQEPDTSLWRRFWDSRPIVGMTGIACLWWAYDIFSRTDSCPSGGKLIGDLVKATCENFGQTVAAGIPFVLGIVSVVFAIRPRRKAET